MIVVSDIAMVYRERNEFGRGVDIQFRGDVVSVLPHGEQGNAEMYRNFIGAHPFGDQ